MSLNEIHLNTNVTPETYSRTVVTKTHLVLPQIVAENNFPRFTRGEFSGAVFLMINDSFGYSVTDGTNCFLPLGEVVTSMAGMVEYHDEDGKYDEHLAHHVGIYQAIYDGVKAKVTNSINNVTNTVDPIAQAHVEGVTTENEVA